ncbi:MAG: imidazole glycerol phosphate synthase subunit HisH [Candidatus Sericytochromatia bacterium]|nr:imidazole glycerol phosphate synthase subunit HisH [Candidatus Sericytochromatia bacterium]
MKVITVGVIDYGMGNQASVIHALRGLGFRVRMSANISELEQTEILILPGVGAFPSAMQKLHQLDLVSYLQEKARKHDPIIGICLGMQLFASLSHEYGLTAGLDLIPGEVLPSSQAKWHIGWNTFESVSDDPLFKASDGQTFYFNHSFYFQGPREYHIAVTRHVQPFVSAIRRNKVVGVQFHPEKSQSAGRELLKNLIVGLIDA